MKLVFNNGSEWEFLPEMSERRLDNTLNKDEFGTSPVPVEEIIERLARMGNQLLPHEALISHLGVGDVTISRLPNSTRVMINWNEPGTKQIMGIDIPTCEDINVLVPDANDSYVYRKGIESALRRYLAPALED